MFKEWSMDKLVQLFLESDEYLIEIATEYGFWMYLILFLIIFLESAVFFAVFLPGDGLLFSSGVVAAVGIVDIWLLSLLLFIAGTSGYIVNYFIGDTIGRRIVNRRRWISAENLAKTQRFYHRHGNSTFILCRFVPVVRSVVPLIAGAAKMDPKKFMTGNLLGGALWVFPLMFAGFYFGELPWVRKNFVIIYLALVVVTMIPLIFGFGRPLRREYIRGKKAKQGQEKLP
jgi:membrane-associated protein